MSDRFKVIPLKCGFGGDITTDMNKIIKPEWSVLQVMEPNSRGDFSVIVDTQAYETSLREDVRKLVVTLESDGEMLPTMSHKALTDFLAEHPEFKV